MLGKALVCLQVYLYKDDLYSNNYSLHYVRIVSIWPIHTNVTVPHGAGKERCWLQTL